MANMCIPLKLATYFCCNNSKNLENLKSYNYFGNPIWFLAKLEFKLIEKKKLSNPHSTYGLFNITHKVQVFWIYNDIFLLGLLDPWYAFRQSDSEPRFK